MISINRLAVGALLVVGTLFASVAFAQPTVTVGSGSGGQGATVDIPVSFDPGGVDVAAFNITITISDPTQFSSITAQAWDGSAAQPCPIVVQSTIQISCSQPAADEIRYVVQDIGSNPIPALQFGLSEFVISNTATTGTIVDLTITTESYSSPSATPVTPGTSTDGQIEILDIAPNLSFSPTSLNFSTETGTTSAAQTVDACNNGNADGLTFSDISISGADAANFNQTNNCPTSSPGLAQGACCQIDTTFSPDAVRSFSASLDLTSSNGSGSVALSGEGTAGPAASLAISPTSHDYGEVLTGESSSQTFTVSNSGETGSDASIDSITPPAGDFSVTGGTCNAGSTTLADGESCTIVLEFAPASDGTQSGDLVVDGTDTNNSTAVQASAAVQGTGVTEARFVSNPAAGLITLGSVPPGGTLSTDVTISNEGNQDLTVDCPSLNDPDGVFTMTPDGFSWTVAPGASDTFNVSCTVPDVSTYEATLSCSTNDADNNPVDYTFRCTGQPLVIPTMQPWGLVLLTLIMLAVGGFSIRFYRA